MDQGEWRPQHNRTGWTFPGMAGCDVRIMHLDHLEVEGGGEGGEYVDFCSTYQYEQLAVLHFRSLLQILKSRCQASILFHNENFMVAYFPTNVWFLATKSRSRSDIFTLFVC